MKDETMNWTSVEHFLHMGGYGLYVWGSYVVTLAVMVGESILSRLRMKAALQSIGNQEEQA